MAASSAAATISVVTEMDNTTRPHSSATPTPLSRPSSADASAPTQSRRVDPTGSATCAGAVIAALLVIVVLSYRQTCYAYPSGGGAFAVSLDNFGANAALTAASALLVDYVMTVAVSVVAGVVAITSAAPSLHKYAV